MPEGTFLAFERPLYDQNAYEYLLQIEKRAIEKAGFTCKKVLTNYYKHIWCLVLILQPPQGLFQ